MPREDDDFVQAGMLYRVMPKRAERLVDNIAGSLAQVSREDIIARSVEHFRKADAELGRRIAEGIANTTRRGGCWSRAVTSEPHPGVVLTPEVSAALATMAANAARSGDVDTLERALNAGVAPNAATPRGDSLLTPAAYYGEVAAVRLLLARGADPNQTDAKGQTPLAGVAFKGLVEIASLLVGAGAGVDASAADGRTPLAMAAAFNRGRMVAWLLEHGAVAKCA